METCNAQRLAAGDVREVVWGGQTGSSVKVESAAHLDTADGLRTGGADGMSRQESNSGATESSRVGWWSAETKTRVAHTKWL
jgi:hypothetical protein